MVLPLPQGARPWLTAAASGILLALSFPRPALSFLAWVALVPMLLAVAGARRARTACGFGYVAGFIFFAASHYWIRDVMKNYGGLNEIESTGIFLAFAAMMALYVGLFGWLTRVLLRLSDGIALFAIPSLWVGIELLRATILTGLPFLLLGYTMADHTLIAQLARFGGVYLLSFVVALFNTAILLLALHSSRRRGRALAIAFFALAIASLLGGRLPVPAGDHTAYLVQANATLDQSWDVNSTHVLVDDLDRRVLAAFARNGSAPGLIVWPEIPASVYYETDELLQQKIVRLAQSTESEVVLNTVSFADKNHHEPLNSAVVVSPDGRTEGRYDKIQLVPFGEYVPYKSLFFFAGRLTSEVGDFVPGQHAVPIGRTHPIGTLICYEGIFPDLVRRFTAGGAQVLVNISNDAWYGQSAAREQLLLMARLRAIENGRWLLRATNTGITAVVDPYGHERTFAPDERAVYPVRFAYRSGETVYVAFGHWFAVLAAIAAVLLSVRGWRLGAPSQGRGWPGPRAAGTDRTGGASPAPTGGAGHE